MVPGAGWAGGGRFNGAATLSSRELLLKDAGQFSTVMLQWGRDVVVAEINEVLDGQTRHYWLQWGRDVVVAGIAMTLSATIAALALQWGRDVVVAEMRYCATRSSATRCFNGAATLSSRKCKANEAYLGDTIELQWGRDVVVAEIRGPLMGSVNVV